MLILLPITNQTDDLNWSLMCFINYNLCYVL